MSNDTKLIKQVLYNLQKLNEKKKKLTKKQQKIDVDGSGTINAKDFELLRKQKSKKEVEDIGEKDSLEEILESFIQLEANPPEYDAPQGSKRAKQIQMSKDDIASGDPERIARGRRRRERMEKEERDKAAKQKKNESLSVSRHQLNELISEAVEAEKLAIMLEKVEELEEKKKRKKRKKRKKKKSGKSSKGLSAAVKKSLDKKADRRGLTRGSVYAEFRKGLAAYYTSGSRKGMTAHQWAHARVNSANPSKSWAVVKKRKGGKKKKKK
tara:strand:+ start:31527 stop:32330 length:804 start_codon:yes stop_codon:yes gene_type:complete